MSRPSRERSLCLHEVPCKLQIEHRLVLDKWNLIQDTGSLSSNNLVQTQSNNTHLFTFIWFWWQRPVIINTPNMHLFDSYIPAAGAMACLKYSNCNDLSKQFSTNSAWNGTLRVSVKDCRYYPRTANLDNLLFAEGWQGIDEHVQTKFISCAHIQPANQHCTLACLTDKLVTHAHVWLHQWDLQEHLRSMDDVSSNSMSVFSKANGTVNAGIPAHCKFLQSFVCSLVES